MSLGPYLRKLVEDPQSLAKDDIRDAMDVILHSKDVPEVQIAAFLAGCRITHRDHQPDFLSATVAQLSKEAQKFDHVHVNGKFVDIVGTGGDGQNTFNVSTTSAIVASGVPGMRVAKHGGPASTSTSGASDLLGALGIDLSRVTATSVTELLNNNDFVYMSGPVFHPILARVRTLRKNLGIPSVFNIVGPLLNPAPISARVLGVYHEGLGPVYAQATRDLYPGTDALVVWGCEGLDEVSIAGSTRVWKLDGSTGAISELTITPADFGVEAHPLKSVASGTPAENAAMVHSIVSGELSRGHPHVDYVLVNCGALLVAAGAATSWKQGADLAYEAITSGAAKASLHKFAQHTQRV